MFVRSLKQADESIEECKKQKEKLETMKMCLQKNRDKDAAQNTMGGMSHVQTLQQRIENITTDIDRLTEELKQATQRAEMGREANTNSLQGEIEKQQAAIVEQIHALDSEVLTKPEVASSQALGELAKIKKKFDQHLSKVKEYQENEQVLNVEHASIPEVEIFEASYEKRFTLWNNRNTFTEQQRKWYLDNFEEQDAEDIVKQVNDYQTQNMSMKMKLKKGEKNDVLMAFSQEV